jgi:hypothetical protein
MLSLKGSSMNFKADLTRWYKELEATAYARKEAAGHAWAMKAMQGLHPGEERMTPDQVYDRCNNPWEGRNPFDTGAVKAAAQYQQILDLVMPPKTTMDISTKGITVCRNGQPIIKMGNLT